MKSPDNSATPHDPEVLLRSGLRDTTPEFEHRWTTLKRRLRTKPVPRRSYAPGWWWGLVSAGITFAVILFVLRPQYPAPRPMPIAELAAYEELFRLEDELHPALPLSENTMLDDLLAMPTPSLDPS
ncbi:MAG TPA: hypothetical protein PK322_00160 [Opitutaceae bacterium]|nr:hypothetical protein [Opitutaceae bacterium]